MENKTGKVTSANFKKEWTGKFGTMYDHTIEFGNGDKGVYTSKTKEQDKFKVGSEVPYTLETVERNGYKNDVIKPITENKGGFGGGNRSFAPKNYKAEYIGYVGGYTKDLVVAGKIELKDFRKTFNAIYNVMEEKLNEVNGATTPNNSEEAK